MSMAGVPPGTEAFLVLLSSLTAVIVIFGLASYLLNSLALGFVFKKMDIALWKAFVPFLNVWIFFKAGGQKPALSLLAITAVIPFVGIIGVAVAAVYSCIAAYRIGLAFNKESWWVLLYIFVPIVWLLVIAFDSSRFNPSIVLNENFPVSPVV